MNKKLLSALLGSVFLCGVMATPVMAQTAKPQVTILATGGTIAGSSASNTDTTDYKAGELGVDTLIRAVPELAEIADVKGEQIANIISDDVDDKILLLLSRRCNELLNSGGQQGVVITHGTDTLEETAFFLDMTVKSERPVVLVGAMRPATAVSADGPMNLLEAVALAAHKGAERRGVMAVLNDRIASGFYVTKTNSTTNDTFKAYEQGYLGVFTSGQPRFFFEPAYPMQKMYFDVSKLESLPRVEIIYMYSGMDAKSFELAMENGAEGIVIASAGNGGLAAPLKEAVQAATAKGYPVVLSTRTGAGYVSSKDYAISAGFLNPQKARLLLQLALATGADQKKIAEYFDKQR